MRGYGIAFTVIRGGSCYPFVTLCNCFLIRPPNTFVETPGLSGGRLSKHAAMKRNRLVIYPKDIRLVTGRTESCAREIIRAIKKRLRKEKHQFVTDEEFCEFSGVSLQELEKHLR